ncbi:hypothetical protein DPMN_172511 [Dreissena polymorpha]|uniref:Uncharacterized protein n=1 Tax=Dreissena polymorpha TaxID=45954 RepID=A0A9D4E2J0_DREPO|nr:hypothetical protein DPMN_172511 [Dreissena polymorpha]
MMQRAEIKKLGHMVQRMAEQCGLDSHRLKNHYVRKRIVQKVRDVFLKKFDESPSNTLSILGAVFNVQNFNFFTK